MAHTTYIESFSGKCTSLCNVELVVELNSVRRAREVSFVSQPLQLRHAPPLTMRQPRHQLLHPSQTLRTSDGRTKGRHVPPHDVVTVVEPSPFGFREERAEGGVAQGDGLVRAGLSAFSVCKPLDVGARPRIALTSMKSLRSRIVNLCPFSSGLSLLSASLRKTLSHWATLSPAVSHWSFGHYIAQEGQTV
jgi:hypothetical protein